MKAVIHFRQSPHGSFRYTRVAFDEDAGASWLSRAPMAPRAKPAKTLSKCYSKAVRGWTALRLAVAIT